MKYIICITFKEDSYLFKKSLIEIRNMIFEIELRNVKPNNMFVAIGKTI